MVSIERAEKRRRCADAKSLFPKVLEYGDERLVPILDRRLVAGRLIPDMSMMSKRRTRPGCEPATGHIREIR